jgi:hypothetical protein
VGYARRNFMVPIPRAASFAELNAKLLERCRRRLGRESCTKPDYAKDRQTQEFNIEIDICRITALRTPLDWITRCAESHSNWTLLTSMPTNTCCCTPITSALAGPSPALHDPGSPMRPQRLFGLSAGCFGGAAIALNARLDRPRNFSTCRAACDFGYSHSPAARYKGFSLRRSQRENRSDAQRLTI